MTANEGKMLYKEKVSLPYLYNNLKEPVKNNLKNTKLHGKAPLNTFIPFTDKNEKV